MSYEDEVASLVIHKTEPDDADVYRCEASNPLGRVQTEGLLTVHSEYFCLLLNLYMNLNQIAKCVLVGHL